MSARVRAAFAADWALLIRVLCAEMFDSSVDARYSRDDARELAVFAADWALLIRVLWDAIEESSPFSRDPWEESVESCPDRRDSADPSRDPCDESVESCPSRREPCVASVES